MCPVEENLLDGPVVCIVYGILQTIRNVDENSLRDKDTGVSNVKPVFVQSNNVRVRVLYVGGSLWRSYFR